MRIALVTQHYPPHFEGGTEAVVRAQARALAARGHAVRVISGTDRAHAGEDVERSVVDGLEVAHLPRRPDEPYGLDLARPRVLELVEREVGEADVAHVHHHSTLSDRTMRALARSRPVFATLHDLFTTCPRFFRLPPDSALTCPARGDLDACVRCVALDLPGHEPGALAAALAARQATFDAELASAAAVFVPSRAHGDRLAPLLGVAPERLVVLPHGLCPPVPERSARAHREGPLRVLHLGHRSAAKGTLDLVRALAAVPAGSVELVLAGAEVEAGFDAALSEAAGRLPLAFRGPYDRADLAALAADADLAAFPSRAYESYGLVVDEALALGLPVLVSDRGALPERIGDAGIALPAEDPAAWTRAIRSLLDDPDLLAALRDALPDELPTADAAARELERHYARHARPSSSP